MSRVIDMWAPILPTPEMLEGVAERFPEQMLGYLRVFFKQKPALESIGPLFDSFVMAEEAVMSALEAAGIGRSLVTGFDERSSAGVTFMPNERVASIAARHPRRIIPFAGIDIFRGMDAVREVEHWIAERGFRGVSLRPFMIGLPPDNRRYYPIYTKCIELGVPVSVHGSANWTTVAHSELGHPRHFDNVACDLPELKLIVSHAGYPWVLEAVQLARKHENLYLELSAHRPKHIALPGTGWEPLLRFGPTTIVDKVLFGSGWFLLGRPPRSVVEEFYRLPLPEPVKASWLGGNAARLLDPCD